MMVKCKSVTLRSDGTIVAYHTDEPSVEIKDYTQFEEIDLVTVEVWRLTGPAKEHSVITATEHSVFTIEEGQRR